MSYQVDSYGNAYFPAGVSVKSIPATTGTQAKVLVPGANGRISSATIAQLVTQSGGNIVSSVFGRTGVVVAKEGDYNTDQITESGGALYFSTSRARKSIFLTTFNTSGPATYDTNTGILNIPQYGSGAASPTNFVPLTRTITINGQTADLSVDRIFSVASMVYPSAGIALSNGVSWEPSITNNSANWNTAFSWGNHALGGYVTLSSTQTITGTKTFSSAVSFSDGYYAAFLGQVVLNHGLSFSDTGNAAIFGNAQAFSVTRSSNTSQINIRRDNAVEGGPSYTQSLNFANNIESHIYTFPSLSGTIALTSNLSSYVPYTGATGAVNLGAYAFQAGGMITTGRTTSDIGGSFVMKIGNGTNTVGDANSVTMYAPSASQLMFIYKDASVTKLVSISPNQPDNSQRYFSWPSVDGQLALVSQLPSLAAYVPYNGATTALDLGNNKLIVGTGNGTTNSHIDVFGDLNNTYLNLESAGYQTIYYNGYYKVIGKQIGYQGTRTINIASSPVTGTNFTINFPNASGTIALTSDIVTYTLPTASTSVLGGVKVDGTTITADVNGIISGANTYSLPTATSTILGGVKIGAGVTITSGVISVSTNYEAPITAGTTLQYFRGDKTFQTLPIYTLSGLGGEPTITAGTTSEYWRGDKSWQTLPIYTLAGLGGQAQLNGTGFVKASGTTITYDNSTYYLSSNPSGYITGYTETDTLSSVTARGASTSTAVVINNSLAVNHSSHYDSAQFSLDVNGGLLVKNVGKTALFLLINSNPATGGNNAFVQHTVGGTLSSSFATIQGYYGASVTGSTVLKLNPLGGDVLIGTLIGTGTRMVVADANGVVSTQAIPSVSTVAWTSVTGRPTALSQFTNDLGNYGGWITSYTETDTLGSVTARGATTSTALTLSSQANNFGGHHYFIAYDAAGNHYPHYQNGSSNTGAIVNTRVYTGSGASWRLFVLNGQTAGISWDGNVIYHAGNIPTWNQNTTGTAANITATTNSTLTTLSSLSLPYSQLSGTVPTWNQSTTGNAATVTNATFYRQFTVRDDRSDGSDYSLAARATGLYAINSTGTNGPGYGYLSLIHVSNGSDVAFQIAGGYNSDAMYFRGTYALQNGTGYSAWRTVIHSGNIASQTVTYATGETLATVTGRGATTSTAVIINNNLAVNTASPYATGTYSLDINGGLLVKNTGRASNITLINADPSGGGNHAFVIHTVSGTLGSSLVDIQGYYGANVTGSTTIRLNPLGGNVTINGYTAYHAGNIPTLNQSTTGNAATSSTFSTGRTNYKGVTDNAVAGQLMWKNYGNSHTIFDASASTSPDGGAVNNTNSGTAWSATYPTLMGWNGSSTYGVRVDSARIADSASSVAWGNVTGRPTALSSFTNDLGNYGGWITSSGSISGTASNITAYTINQSVGSGNSPTFAGLTVSGPVYQGLSNQGVISLLSDINVTQTNNYYRLYVPQGYVGYTQNGGMATIRVVWGQGHAGVTYSQEYKLTFGTNHGAGGNYLYVSDVTRTYKDQNPESYGGYLMDQTPAVDFYQDVSGGYINFNVKGYHGQNTHRIVSIDITGGGTSTPTLTYYGASSPGGSALTVKDIPYATTAGSANSVAWTNVSSRPTTTSAFTNDSGFITSGSNVVGLYSSGFGSSNFTWYQSPGGLQQYGGGWASFLISNHGAGVDYYNQTIIMPFWGAPQYMRKEGNVNVGPWTFYTTENLNPITTSNIGSQSVSYASSAGSAPNSTNQNPAYLVTPGEGNGLKLWADDNYKISMGASSVYQYGTVTDYSIKTQMNAGDAGRGFTWGRIGIVPIASLNATSGNMQIAGSFTAGADITAYSDIRVKDNIEIIPNALSKVKAIRGVTFTRKDALEEDKNKRHAGVIAQEVLEVLPEVVNGSEDSVYSVAYGNMAALFIEAIKEQQAQIEEMKKEIKELKNK